MKLNSTMIRFSKVISEATYLLSLEDDWDGEGAVGYSENTWNLAMDFLHNYYKYIENLNSNFKLRVPTAICPDINGAIGIMWDTEEYDYLVSITTGGVANYYILSKSDTFVSKGSCSCKEKNLVCLPIII